MARTVKCANFWDALVLRSLLEEQGVQVRQPDEVVPLSMVVSGDLDRIKAAVAQLGKEFPRSGPIIIEGEPGDDRAPEPPGDPKPPEPIRPAERFARPEPISEPEPASAADPAPGLEPAQGQMAQEREPTAGWRPRSLRVPGSSAAHQQSGLTWHPPASAPEVAAQAAEPAPAPAPSPELEPEPPASLERARAREQAEPIAAPEAASEAPTSEPAPAPEPAQAPGPAQAVVPTQPPEPPATEPEPPWNPELTHAPEQAEPIPAPEPASEAPTPEPAPVPEPAQALEPAPKPPPPAPAPTPPHTPKPPPQAPPPTQSGGSRAPEPSWGTVLATTLRLWAQRHLGRWWPTQTRWRLVVMAALAAVVFVAGVTVELAGFGRGEPTPSRLSGGTSIGAGVIAAAQATRQHAAAWVASQVSADAVVACDPAMCAALQAADVRASRLMVLTPASADPLGSGLVVATPVVRALFGTRLASVYAPVTLAAFGSGAARIDIRMVAPDGAAAYRAQLVADLRARRTAGARLLHNHDIHLVGAARAAVANGEVDPRLLVTLAALSHLHPVEIVRFDGSDPGASAGVPLRSADIAGAVPPGGGRPASLASLGAFFRAQRAPYLPSSLETVRISPTGAILRVEYRAPCPLGLLGTSS